MRLRFFLAGLIGLVLSLAAAAAPGKATAATPRQLDVVGKPWTGDFEQMLDRHTTVRLNELANR